jgi:hypothetical protein
MSMPTSSGGLSQFSLEKANMVTNRMSRCAQSSTTRRTTLTLERWPATRGKPRSRAHRPLPSMMIATCCGVSAMWCRKLRVRLDLHQFLFLVGHRVIDIGNVLVGELLDLVLGAPIVVLR